MSVIPKHWRQRQENQEFKACLGYISENLSQNYFSTQTVKQEDRCTVSTVEGQLMLHNEFKANLDYNVRDPITKTNRKSKSHSFVDSSFWHLHLSLISDS